MPKGPLVNAVNNILKRSMYFERQLPFRFTIHYQSHFDTAVAVFYPVVVEDLHRCTIMIHISSREVFPATSTENKFLPNILY